MNKILEENNKKADMCVSVVEQINKETLIQGLRVFNQSMSYTSTIIRWNQQELALLRTLETLIRTNSDNDYKEGEAGILLDLDNMREEHRKQQEEEVTKAETQEAMEATHGGTEH